MRSDPHDAGERFFQAARWYLPPMSAEPEPDPTLACTYALLALYTKLERLIAATPVSGDEARNTADAAQATADAARDMSAMLRTLGWEPPRQLRKGLGQN